MGYIKKINCIKFTKLLYVLFFLSVMISDCFAITSTIVDNYNFGTFTQTNSSASFILSYDGSISSISGLSQSGTPVVGKVTYTTEQNGDNLSFNTSNSVVQLDGCTLTFSNITPSLTGIVLNPGQGKVRDVLFGVTVNIDGFCAKGTYNVSGVQIDAIGSKTNANTILLPLSITFNEHIEIIQTQVLNFGKFFNNSSGGQIIINPDGNFEANGIDMFDSNVLSSGTFTIGGLINREVQISFTDAIISNGSSTMTVNNIIANTGTNFTVIQDKMPISIGGTLNVGANQPVGIYEGTYTINITY